MVVHSADPFMEFTTKAKRKQQVCPYRGTIDVQQLCVFLLKRYYLLQRADSAKDNKVIEVRRSGSVTGSTRGGRGAGRGDRQSVDRVRSGRGRLWLSR